MINKKIDDLLEANLEPKQALRSVKLSATNDIKQLTDKQVSNNAVDLFKKLPKQLKSKLIEGKRIERLKVLKDIINICQQCTLIKPSNKFQKFTSILEMLLKDNNVQIKHYTIQLIGILADKLTYNFSSSAII